MNYSPLIPIAEPEKLAEAGLPWNTKFKAQWAFRKRHENGLAGAFYRNGNSVLVDVAKAHELLRARVA
jgi:hypothetical protein